MGRIILRLLSHAAKATFFIRTFGFLKVPLIYYCKPKVLSISEESVEIKIPLNRKTKNHVNSMYFGVLSVGADITGAMIAMDLIKKSNYNINLLFKDFNADFLKRAEGDVHFICKEGKKISDMIHKVVESKQRINQSIEILAFVPEKFKSEPIAKFSLTLSLKEY
tara:strand:- start:977 stop:1471 length:495 start_codon:yes stop_codon:yes gene_type:complete